LYQDVGRGIIIGFGIVLFSAMLTFFIWILCCGGWGKKEN
jgi:hypothetical protein